MNETKSRMNDDSTKVAHHEEIGNSASCSRRVFICKSGKIIALGVLSHFALSSKIDAKEFDILEKSEKITIANCVMCDTCQVCDTC